MRIVRVIVGMLLLTVGVPVLLVGAILSTIAQHRDPGGAFSGAIPRVDGPGAAIVANDLDALLRRDAPFTRARDTRLRLIAVTESGPAFVGIGPAPQVAAFLDRLPHARVDGVGVARGPLPLRLIHETGGSGRTPVAVAPVAQPFWVAHGIGTLDWSPYELRGRELALVVMRPDGQSVTAADLRVEVRPGWLDPVRWAALSLGVLLVVAGMAVLAWPIRAPRATYADEPASAPGAGPASPSASTSGRTPASSSRAVGVPPDWPVPAGRPATLADMPALKRPLPPVSLTLTATRLQGPLALRKAIKRGPSNQAVGASRANG